MSAAVLPASPPAGDRAVMRRLMWLSARIDARERLTLLLPLVAFAVSTGLLLLVVAGTALFLSWGDDPVYPALGAFACALLLVPLFTLSGLAARLSARRRDDRLATLRLLGATARTVTGLTILESTALALTGAVAGIALYVLAVPLVGLVPFRGAPIGAGALWVSPAVVVAVVLVVGLVAAASAALGLRQVRISPLGVRARTDAPRLHGSRPVIALAVLVAAGGALTLAAGSTELLILVVVMCGAFFGAIAVMNLVGPWALRLVAAGQLRATRSVAGLIAARTVLEDPRAAWRQVSGVAMTTLVAVIAGAVVTMTEGAADSTDPLIPDIRTGMLLTMGMAFVMVACAVGVSQAAQILDRRELWVALERAGMPRATMRAARRGEILLPLVFAVASCAAVGGLLVLPLIGTSVLFAPGTLLVLVGCAAGGVALVAAAVAATTPVLGAVLAEPARG